MHAGHRRERIALLQLEEVLLAPLDRLLGVDLYPVFLRNALNVALIAGADELAEVLRLHRGVVEFFEHHDAGARVQFLGVRDDAVHVEDDRPLHGAGLLQCLDWVPRGYLCTRGEKTFRGGRRSEHWG